MKYFLFLITMKICFSAKSQDGKIIEQIKIATSPDSVLKHSNPYYDSLKRILDNVDVYRITYLSDGLKVKGYMDIPKKPGKYPCVIKNRGGNRETSKLQAYNYMGDMAEMASWGYCVVASQYRGNDGGEGAEDLGGKDIDDVMNMIPLLNNVNRADTSRIGMLGTSRGGMMTYLALARTNLIKAAIIISAPTDLKLAIASTNWADTLYSHLLPEYREDKEAWIKKRSAILFADKICRTTPIFIIQGTADDRVPTPQILEMAKKLYELKQPFRLAMFEGGGHGVHEFYIEVPREEKIFFDDYLRDGKKWPSLTLHQ